MFRDRFTPAPAPPLLRDISVTTLALARHTFLWPVSQISHVTLRTDNIKLKQQLNVYLISSVTQSVDGKIHFLPLPCVIYVPCNNVVSASLFSLYWDGMMYLLTSCRSPEAGDSYYISIINVSALTWIACSLYVIYLSNK